MPSPPLEVRQSCGPLVFAVHHQAKVVDLGLCFCRGMPRPGWPDFSTIGGNGFSKVAVMFKMHEQVEGVSVSMPVDCFSSNVLRIVAVGQAHPIVAIIVCGIAA